MIFLKRVFDGMLRMWRGRLFQRYLPITIGKKILTYFLNSGSHNTLQCTTFDKNPLHQFYSVIILLQDFAKIQIWPIDRVTIVALLYAVVNVFHPNWLIGSNSRLQLSDTSLQISPKLVDIHQYKGNAVALTKRWDVISFPFFARRRLEWNGIWN